MTWLAAEYGERVIQQWFVERKWPKITQQAISYYRVQLQEEIEQRRDQRRARALNTGLALKEERVERLKQHADALEELKWIPDEKGKLHNEKAWRETLDDIAKELGHRRTGMDVNVSKLSDEELIARTQALLGGDGAAGLDTTEPTEDHE